MSRFIILEIDQLHEHDLTDFIETMREMAGGRAQLMTSGLYLNVKIPPRWDAHPVGGIGGTGLDVYVAQEA